jgi:hypothetical protein
MELSKRQEVLVRAAIANLTRSEIIDEHLLLALRNLLEVLEISHRAGLVVIGQGAAS